MNILLAGFGDIASRLASRLPDSSYQIFGLRRTPQADAGTVSLCQGDMRNVDLLSRLLGQGMDALVVTLTPGQFTDAAYEASYVEGASALARAIAGGARAPGYVIWVSSTRVYGQNHGEWVDEQSATEPTGFAGRRLLEAERIVRALPVPNSIVRFSGIYGPGRTRMIEQVRQGDIAPAEPVVWTNRIHSEDCAGLLAHVLERHRLAQPVAPIYLGTDCEPAPLHQVHCWLAKQLGVAVREQKSAARRSNRRCRNRLILDTGYIFQYPSYREGLSVTNS